MMQALRSACVAAVAAPEPHHHRLTRKQLEAWVGQAAPGDQLAYHQGYLIIDRVRGSSALPEADRRELVVVADAALALARRGEIHLVQRRLGPGTFSYLAVKAHQGSVPG